jgi:hypothetical protein
VKDFGIRDDERQFVALVKVDRQTKRLIGRSRVWVDIDQLARSFYLHQRCLDGIWLRIKDKKYQRSLAYLAIGSTKKRELKVNDLK